MKKASKKIHMQENKHGPVTRKRIRGTARLAPTEVDGAGDGVGEDMVGWLGDEGGEEEGRVWALKGRMDWNREVE